MAKVLLWGGVTLAALFVLFISGGWAAIGTETGRRFIADRIEQAASDGNLVMRIGRLSGALPAELDLADITLADRDGPVARIDRLSVSWHPLALLSKRLSVERIALSGVAVERLPAAPEAETADAGGALSLATGFDIDIAAISASDIALAPAIAGSVAHLSAAGSFGLSADASRAQIGIDVRRIDGSDGRASLVLDYAAEPARFTASLDVEEPSGGPIAALAGMTGEFPLTVRLDGAGPPEAWQGRLVGAAGPSGVELDLLVGVAARAFTLRIDGAVRAGSLLPERVAAVMGRSARISTALSFGAETGWRVESARLSGERLTLTGSGSYRPETGAVAGDGVLEVPAATGPMGLPGLQLGAARVAARVSGTASQPIARMEVTASEIEAPFSRLASVQANFDLAPAGAGRLTVKGSANLGGIALDEPVPAGLIGSDATLEVEASWLPRGGFSIARLALASDGLSLTADGRSDDGVALAGSYELSKSGIGALMRAAALGGDLRLGGSYRLDLARLAGEVELVGDLDRLRGHGALLGSAIALTGAVARAEDGRIDLIGLEIAGAGGTLRARATVDADSRSISAGHLVTTLPDLSRLAIIAGMPVAGRASLEAEIAGPLDALAGTGNLRLEQIAAGAVALDHVGIGFGFRSTGSGVAGAVKVAIAKGETRLPGAFDFAFDATKLRLSEILFAGDGNRFWGNLELDLASGMARGAIDAQLADVASLGAIAAGPVSGALTLGVKLEAAAGQRVTLAAAGTSLRIGSAAEAESVTIGGLTLAATVEDALRARRISGKVELRDFARDQAVVSRAALEVTTDGTGRLRFDGAIDGSYRDPLSLRLAGTSVTSGDGLGVELTRLDGSVGAVKIALTAPARIQARDSAWSGSMALLVGGGNVTATAAVDPASVALSLAVAEMPLAAFGTATRHLEAGAIWSARLDLSGAPSNPRGAVTVSAQGLRPAGASWSAADALAVSLDGTLADGRVTFAGRISGPDAAEVTATASLPVTLALAPVPLLEIPDGAIAGTAALRGRLEMIEALVDLGENWLSGAASASIELAGTTRAPEIRGAAQLAGGRFEGVQTGVVVGEIEAVLRFDGTRLQIARLTASDAGQGRLAGTGELRFEGEDWPLDLALTFTRFAAIARDDATLSASGEVRVLGNVSKPRIEGRLTVDGGEIRIPDRIGSTVVSLDVVEINRRTGPSASAQIPGPTTPGPTNAGSAASAPRNGAGGIALDVTVAAPGRVFVRGRGLDSEWSGDLTVAGTTAQPRIVGVLSVVRGSFALAGRNLAVTQGSVTFRAGQVDPEIDTRATLLLGGTEITVQVSGRASAPTVSLSSVPSMPSEEILAMMLFGKSAGDLTAFQAAQLARSAAALSGNFSGDSLLDRARRGLGVDALTVETQGETARGTALKAGKYVADGVFVTVQQGASADSQKVAVEVEVTPSITVETGVGPSAGSSIGLNWKLDY